VGRKKYWVVQKRTSLFLKQSKIHSALTIYDVWEQSEKEGLKLEALLMRLGVVRQGFVDLVKRSENFLFSLKLFDIPSFYQVSESLSNNPQTQQQSI
jgi:hypothetical protein